jgi:hypothetical protein
LHITWQRALHHWLVETDAFTFTVRKGRRIGASTVIAPRLIAAWVLVAVPLIHLPPGEIVVVGLVSVKKGEASNRIKQISAVLHAVGVPHVAKTAQIDLIGAPVEIRVITRNWKTAVGENIGLLWCDEVSRWESDESSANPATEVIGSLKPALATLQVQGLALMCLVSSPWSMDDYHAQQYDRGDTEDQCTAFMPTWTARDDISEEQTHRLEADERVWSREYAAIPGHMVSTALDPDDARAAFGMVLPVGNERQWCVIDASSLRGDCFAWMVGHESRGGMVVDDIGGWANDMLDTVTLDSVVQSIAAICRARGITRVYGDQREEAGLSSLFTQQNITFDSIAWTINSKHSAFLGLRRLLKDRRVQLPIPPHAQLLREMRGCKARLLPSGVTSYETNGLDYLSCLVTLLHAYERYWPQALSRMLAGGGVGPTETEDEKRVRLAAEQRAKNRRDAERRASGNRRQW